MGLHAALSVKRSENSPFRGRPYAGMRGPSRGAKAPGRR